MDYGGVTYVLKRTQHPTTLFDTDWNSVKAGFPSTLQDSDNFFVGLENLHDLTSQSHYTLHISLDHFSLGSYGGRFYTKFAVGTESSNYALTFET